MTMNNSIMAAVGRPQTVATAVRIPVQGPYNTLVVVQLRNASLLPGVQWNTCEMERHLLSYPSTFVLQGFDPRVPPDFKHSTTGFLSYLGTGNDATFTYAIDEVSARFDEMGRYWVDYRTAMLNDCEVSAASCSLTSWLLVNEPLPQAHSGSLGHSMTRHAYALGTQPGVFIGKAGLQALLGSSSCDCKRPSREPL